MLRKLRGATTKLRANPFTETDVHEPAYAVYQPTVQVLEPIPADGTYTAGLHRLLGYVFVKDHAEAARLMSIGDEIDLIVRYTSDGGSTRKLTFYDVIFIGGTCSVDSMELPATVGRTVPGLSRLRDEVVSLVGVPFRCQIASPATVDSALLDEAD